MEKVAKYTSSMGGLDDIENEIGLLMTSMRRGIRWNSHSYQDEEQDVLIKSLASLKEALNDYTDLSQIDPGVLTAPFLEIIRSEKTIGPVTTLALSAVQKILSYGLLDLSNLSVDSCVEAIADAVTHARFVGTDAAADGTVLLTILHVLRTLVISSPGDNLSNESICEIMLSTFRICFELRLNDLLRKTAEFCLRDMVQHLFEKLPQFSEDTRILPNMKVNNKNTRCSPKKSKAIYKAKFNSNDILEYSETQTSLLSPVDRVKANYLATTPITPPGNIVDMQGPLNQTTSCQKQNNECKETITDELLTQEQNLTKEVDEYKNMSSLNYNVKISVDEKSTLEIESNKTGVSVLNSVSTTNEMDSQNHKKSFRNIKKQFAQSLVGSDEDLTKDEITTEIIKIDEDSLDEYANSQGVQFSSLQQHVPYGSLCIRELFRFLGSLCNPHDKQNTESMMHIGLSLLRVALERASNALSNFPSLLALIKDDLTKNLILLLGTERISILTTNLQVAFLLFKSQREHLKFQLEQFIIKLMDLVNSDSNRISYEQRELALETIVRLWKISGLPSELFINYDCGLYSVNLFEDLMKMFSKNINTIAGDMYSMQYISLDAIFSLIIGVKARCHKNLDDENQKASISLPSKEKLIETKTKKRLLHIGSEKFNENPREGIAKLAEERLLGGTPGHPDPDEIAKLLRENPTLDKKAIGEYLSKKENTSILQSFVHSFNLQNTRIDQAVRQYMETFRLPGEAPLISLLLEKFAEHWHESNNKPFASADAAFTLAYAIIMLNVDQHNHNVKRQNIPMTAEDFKKNLKKINGGADFDQDMLDEIYKAIKNEEIIMPAEQTGLVKENYLWKCLLRRGASPESKYIQVKEYGKFIDKELIGRAWAPIISALCRAYDKTSERTLQRKIIYSFQNCAEISDYYNMTSDLDTLIVSLYKFTGLGSLASDVVPDQIVLKLGSSGKCQLATQTLFKICHFQGSSLRASWKIIIDCLLMLYKAKLLPNNITEGGDFVNPSGKVNLIKETPMPKASPIEQGLLSSLYSYIAPDVYRMPSHDEIEAKKRAYDCVKKCFIKEMIDETKNLKEESLISLIKALISSNLNDEGTSVFVLEQLINITIINHERIYCTINPGNNLLHIIQEYLEGLLTISSRENQPYLLERVTVNLLRLSIKLNSLSDPEEDNLKSSILFLLEPLTYLVSTSTTPLSRQISYGLFELLKLEAANIHSSQDWKIVFNLLECSGAGALQPKHTANLDVDKTINSRKSPVPGLEPRPASPVPEWVLVSCTGTEAPLPVAADIIVLDRDFQPHDPQALVKCCESLVFLVRDVAHVTPFNFESCVRCVRTFSEAVLSSVDKRSRAHEISEKEAYQRAPLQLLDLMHTLHNKAAHVFLAWDKEVDILWPIAWKPLLQGIARLCCDSRKAVRAAAITSLQSTLLAHDLSQLAPVEWSQCLEQVLFPLLAQLLRPIATDDPIGLEETRVRAAMLLSKVFLHHLNQLLKLNGFLPLWLTVLDLLRAYMHVDNSEMLLEAIPESLKNMLLVMASAKVLKSESYLWIPTWRAIDKFLPTLKNELFPSSMEFQTPLMYQSQLFTPQSPVLPSLSLKNNVLQNQSNQLLMYHQLIPPHQMSKENLHHQNQYHQQYESVDNSILSTKESQQVITLVNQQPPTVSSAVAVQPFTHVYNPVWEQKTEIQPSCKFNYTQQTSVEDNNSQDKHQYLSLQNYSTISYPDSAELVNHSKKSEIQSQDSTAIFNSSVYFTEDPVADRLFAIIN